MSSPNRIGFLLALLASGCATQAEPRHHPSGPMSLDGPRQNGTGERCPTVGGALADGARRAVDRALADERRAESIYAAIDRQLGPGTPFTRIVQAERRHASALETVLLAHGLPLPAAEAVASPSIGDRKSACALGVASERANIAMYDELLAGVLPPDVRCVFEHLRAASKERHQPAFERCDGR